MRKQPESFNECPVCAGKPVFYTCWQNRDYYRCSQCSSLLMHPAHYPATDAERARYETHNNDVHDTGYQQFVAPIVDSVSGEYTPDLHGLDYGSGTGPVISYLLEQKGFTMHLYDPLFAPDTDVLLRKYPFIVCCEVMEHFHNPMSEFRRLFDLLEPGGALYCMTDFYSEDRDFKSWNYKNDPTHVIMYHTDALPHITRLAEFGSFTHRGRLVVFRKGH